MKKLLFLLLPVMTVLISGCGDSKADKLETPHELNRLTTGVFRAAKANNYVSAARQIEKLKVHYPYDMKLAKLHRVEMDNITIVRAQALLRKGDIAGAQRELATAIHKRGESLALDAANKELQTLISLTEAVAAASSARSAGDLKFQLNQIDALIKKYPKAALLSAGLMQRRRLQKNMERREKQMALFDLLSDIELVPVAKQSILKAQFEFENQRSTISIQDELLK